MALTGIRQMSTVDTPPEDRQPVLTYVGSLRRRTRPRGRPPRAPPRGPGLLGPQPRRDDRSAGRVAAAIELPDARIVVAHGQMDEDAARAADDRVLGARRRRARVHDDHRVRARRAEREHAGRRPGRHARARAAVPAPRARGPVSSERAFAYLFFPPQRELTEEAHERLATISQHQALGSGFRIAMRDLEIRGAGNLLGAEQTGTSPRWASTPTARILQRVRPRAPGRADRRGEGAPDRPAGQAFVPPGWVAQESLRLELYRRISLAADHDALGRILEETIDRYGALPPEVQTLFAIASLRVTCAALGDRGGLDVSRAGAHPARRPRRRAASSISRIGCPDRRTTRRSGR